MRKAEEDYQALVVSGFCSCTEISYSQCNGDCPHCIYFRQENLSEVPGMRHLSELIDEFLNDLVEQNISQIE